MKPVVSFVMPVRNCSAFIAHTIRGLLKQSLKGIEIIIIDDASEDSTSQVIGHFVNEDDRIKYIQLPAQGGAAHARNEGNKIVDSELICVADAGDVNHVDRAIMVYEFFRDNEDKEMLSTGVEIIDMMGKTIGYEFPQVLELGKRPRISHPTCAYRKIVSDTIKYREESLNTDLYEIFFLDAIKEGFRHGITNEVFVKKRDITLGGRDVIDAWKTKAKWYKKYGLKIPEHAKRYLKDVPKV